MLISKLKISLPRKKRLKLSYKTSTNLEDLDFHFVLQHFKLCLFVNEGDEETNS